MRQASNAFRRLSHVFAAIDHGSLRQAARALRVRESSVSRNIVALEQFLDMQLFDRDVRGVRLTEAGQAWIGGVRAHYEGLQEALEGHRCSNQHAKTLRIGLCALMGRGCLMRLVDRFRKSNPDVILAIEDISHEQCLAAIRRRRLDIVFAHELQARGLCRNEVFGHERLFVLLPAGHPLSERQSVTWADLASTRLLVPVGPEDASCDMRILNRLVRNGDGPTVELCPVGQATVIFKVQLGQGIALACESFAKTVAIGRTVWKPLDGRNSVSSIRAVWLESNPNRALLRLVATARNLANAPSFSGERSRYNS